MQNHRMKKLASELFHNALPIAMIILLYISIYYANINSVHF